MFLKDSNNFIVDKANTLTTARTINGTSFNGSANITTAQWGTARNLQIGSTAKSVNGSANVTWSLSEIGAAASSHTHNYAGSSSAGGAANSATKLQTARTINGTSFDGSANITTANWGTARTLTIGNTGKSVNGSANISWTLDEVGAASRSPFSNTYKQITVGGDANTYYPVLITMNRPGIGYPWYNISISRAYNATAPDTWHNATHRGGLTFQFRWSGDTGWGGNDHNLQVVEFHESYTTMVAGFTLSVSGIVVWLRGGGALYQLNCEQGIGINATVTLGTYTSADDKTYPVRTNTNSVANEIHKLWVQRGGEVYDNNSRVYSANNKPTPAAIGAASTAVATTSANGLMSKTDKSKLDSISTNSQFKITIPSGSWAADGALYSNTIAHNLNKEILYISAYDSATKKSIFTSYTIVNNNSVKVSIEQPLNVVLTIVVEGGLVNLADGGISDSTTTLTSTWSSTKIQNTISGAVKDGTTSQKGVVQLSSATNSTSTTLAATASAVKAAYDLANNKIDKSSIKISTADPSGGKHGDIWFKYE